MVTTPSDSDPPRATLFGEIKRRRVHRVAMAYTAGAFALVQGLDLLVEAFLWPPLVFRLGMIAVLVGFPVALVVAWFYDFDEGRLRRTGADGSERRSSPARFAVGVGVVLLAGGLLWWVRPAPASGNVVEGADVIAVLPFRASGPGTDGLGEGMVDLLSTNLDEVGDIRTLDPAVVLRAWAGRAGGGPLAEAEGVALGRDIGAGSVLTGQLSVAGGTARLTAELLSTVDGRALSRVDVEGPEADLFRLVDSLSVEMLREVWRSRSPLPRLELASITTSDPDALRAYLDGEAHRRRAELDSAEVALTRAIDADSTFALAALRLSSVVGWRDPGSERDTEAQALAERHEGRLPASMRRVMRASIAWEEGRFVEARDSIEAVLAVEPDDPLAWFLLGEILFHGKSSAVSEFWDVDTDSVLFAFRRSLDIQPQDATALIHPLGLTLERLDRAAFERLLAEFESVAGAEQAAPIRAVGAFTFEGVGSPSELWLALARSYPALLPHLPPVLLASDTRDAGAFVDSVWAAARAGEAVDGYWNLIVSTLQALGRMDDAERLAAERLSMVDALRSSASALFVGITRSAEPPAEALEAMGGVSVWSTFELVPGLWQGSTADAARMLEQSEVLERAFPPEIGEIGRAYRLWARIVQGDSTAAVAELEDIVLGWPSLARDSDVLPADFVYLPLLRVRANQPETADIALRRLQSHPWFTTEMIAPQWIAEAEALEALGRPDEAQELYQRVVRLMRDADPDATLWRDLAEARLGLLGDSGA